MQKPQRTYGYLIIALLLLVMGTGADAQSQTVKKSTVRDSLFIQTMKSDSIIAENTYKEIMANSPIVADSGMVSASKPQKIWKPDVQTATWLALVIPGGGQIYNRKYWKLPIVYGGFVGCMYAYNWNGQMYKDYRQAYLDIMDSDPNTNSFKDFFRPGYNFDANKEYLKSVFKKRKDRYRRWRDLSIFATIGVYALSVIDAYVDAQLATFDINDDVNLTIEPQMMQDRIPFSRDNNYYGLNCHITF